MPCRVAPPWAKLIDVFPTPQVSMATVNTQILIGTSSVLGWDGPRI